MNELHKAFEAGYSAFFAGSFTNPYKTDTLPGKEWQRGWDKGYDNNYWANRMRSFWPQHAEYLAGRTDS